MGLLQPAIQGGVIDFDPYTTSSIGPDHEYGAYVQTNFGRDAYRYALAGGSNISRGKLELAAAPIANHQAQTIDSTSLSAIGSKHLILGNGGTAAALGEYDQGTIVITNGTGLGQRLPVLHNQAATSAQTIGVDLDTPLQTAIVAGTTKYALVHNPYNAVVEAASATRTAAGVPLVSVTASQYCFLQTKGIAAVLIGSAATLGSRLISDGSTAGAVTDNTDVTAPQTEVQVGSASIMAGTTADYDPIVLSIN